MATSSSHSAQMDLLTERSARIGVERFVLDDSNPQAQRCMLSKLHTYEQAVAAGVPTPRFWTVATRDDVIRLRDELAFPVLAKPLYSHRACGRALQQCGPGLEPHVLLEFHVPPGRWRSVWGCPGRYQQVLWEL